MALIYFVCCGVSRLARFNVTAETLAAGSGSGKVAYFEGTPIPTSVVLTAVLAFAAWQGRIGRQTSTAAPGTLGPWELHPLSLLFVALGQPDDQQDAAHPEAVAGPAARALIGSADFGLTGAAQPQPASPSDFFCSSNAQHAAANSSAGPPQHALAAAASAPTTKSVEQTAGLRQL